MTAASAMRPTGADLRALLAPHQPPCVSLYEPTHRSYPASRQEDPIRYRSLLHRAEKSLRESYPARLVRPVLDKLERFGADSGFWIEAAAGLAVFGSADDLKVFKLQQSVPELLSVADRFQIKPLIRSIQCDGRYQLLALTLAEATLYEGTRDSLDAVDLGDAPTTVAAALGAELTQSSAKVGHGHGSGEQPLDRERFFRAIDREILERASKASRLPLVLAALPEHQAHFRALSHNPFLVASGVELNPLALSRAELRDAAWRAIEAYFEEGLRALLDAYGEARGHGRGSDRLEDIAAAMAQSRVGTLLLEADRRVPGSVDTTLGTIHGSKDGQSDGGSDPRVSDVLDDLAEAALRTGGEVMVLQTARMPSKTGAAAIFRY